MNGEIPDGFRSRIEKQGYVDKNTLFHALSQNSEVSIRLNPAKWSGVPREGEKIPWCKTGYYLKSRPSFTLDPLLHAGCYYVQEASSMFLEQAFFQINGNAPGLRILDLCGAPGGKTTHLSSLAGKGSVIIANEVIKSRASVLAENVVKWGMGNIIVTSSDPVAFGRMTGYFDIILVDAPCSGEGMFRDLHVRDEWSENNCKLCSGRQQRILSDVWPALREGGHIIYSTCTFNPEENELQVSAMLKEYKCSSVPLDISSFPGIVNVPDKSNSLGYGFHPGKISGEGFFLSVIKKEESSETFRAPKNTGLKSGTVSGTIIDQARTLAEVSDDIIDDFGGTIIALPLPRQEFHQLASKLKIVKGGTALFTLKQGSLLPAHDLAVSVLLKGGQFPTAEITYGEAVAYLRNDSNLGKQFDAKGWILLTFRDVRLGFIKNIGPRINNYYPAGWRIRMDMGKSEPTII